MVIQSNPKSAHLRDVSHPTIDETVYLHPQAFVCGDVTIGRSVFVAPFASIRADEGSPFYIGDESNVQDGVVLHALETFHEDGRSVDKHLFEVDGKRYAIYIGRRVSLAHQSQIHGPAVIGDDTFIGMQAFVFKARIGKGVVIEPAAKVIGVNIPDQRCVPAGEVINSEEKAARLPLITATYPLATLNSAVIHVNSELARAYQK